MTEWPLDDNTSEEALHPYLTRKDELSVNGGCLLWGPRKGRKLVVKELHEITWEYHITKELQHGWKAL